MNRNQIENIYRANGLDNFKVASAIDLLKVHGIDFKGVDGYKDLDEFNRAVYEKFIVNYFNAQGLESRALIIPVAIYWAEDSDYLVKEDVLQDYYSVAGGIVYSIDKTGKKTVMKEWVDPNFKHLEREIEAPKSYLRFEYQHGTLENGEPRYVWLHVSSNGVEWY